MPAADGLAEFLSEQPLLALTMAAIFASVAGGMLRRSVPLAGHILRGAGSLGLVAALLLTIAQVARFTTTSDVNLPQFGLPKQTVEGGETRIPMNRDGHFWLTAAVNGRQHRFMVDTGATLTAIAETTATDAGVQPKSIGQTISMHTANGTVRAELATIDELKFGNIAARNLDAVIAPGLGNTNVIGMNLLSRLAGWRVEGRTLILQPQPGQPTGQIGSEN